jgi:RNA polymerase sigma-B factor
MVTRSWITSETAEHEHGAHHARQSRDGYDHLMPLFDEMADPACPAEDRRRLRERLIEGHMQLARHLAQRFARRGQPLEDLFQVAMVGLMHAVDRFDTNRGKHFLSFAVPTITGELRRYFRDHTWTVRVPRRLQELRAGVNAAIEDLGQRLGRAPTASELAGHLGVTVGEIYDCYQAAAAYQPVSLEHLTAGQEETVPAVEVGQVGVEDTDLANVEDRALLAHALDQLSDRDRTIVGLRFFRHLPQSQIAQRMGISQMQVSRVLSGSLATLHRCITENAQARV